MNRGSILILTYIIRVWPCYLKSCLRAYIVNYSFIHNVLFIIRHREHYRLAMNMHYTTSGIHRRIQTFSKGKEDPLNPRPVFKEVFP